MEIDFERGQFDSKNADLAETLCNEDLILENLKSDQIRFPHFGHPKWTERFETISRTKLVTQKEIILHFLEFHSGKLIINSAVWIKLLDPFELIAKQF